MYGTMVILSLAGVQNGPQLLNQEGTSDEVFWQSAQKDKEVIKDRAQGVKWAMSPDNSRFQPLDLCKGLNELLYYSRPTRRGNDWKA